MFIIVKELGITSDDVKNHNDRNELKLYKIELDSIIAKLDYELDDYKLKYKLTGISGDYDWFIRAKSKRKLYGLMTQLIQTRLAIIKKEQHEEQRNSFHAILMRKIKDKIGEEELNELIDQIHDELCTTY